MLPRKFVGTQESSPMQAAYRAGKQAFDCGRYRESIEALETALAGVNRRSRLGGEILLWLVSAYQAAARESEAIALCQELEGHPFHDIRAASQRLSYVLQAPTLSRPREWSIEIPALDELQPSDPKDRRGSRKAPMPPSETPIPPAPGAIATEDNAFALVALVVVLSLLVGAIWLG